MNTKHTAGPWHFDGELYFRLPSSRRFVTRSLQMGTRNRGREQLQGVRVCEINEAFNGSGPKYGPDSLIDEEERIANARLIAAAPELLEVAELLEYALTNKCTATKSMTIDEQEYLLRARAIIAKARGEA